MSIVVGQKFKSYSEMKEFLENYEKNNYLHLWTAHSRTIEGARKKGLLRYIHDDLKYTEIMYKCLYGGVRKASRSTGIRPNQNSYRQGCPFILRLKVALDGETLDVVEFKNEHNHSQEKEIIMKGMRNRKLLLLKKSKMNILGQEASITNASPTLSEVKLQNNGNRISLLNKNKVNISGQKTSSTNASPTPIEVQQTCENKKSLLLNKGKPNRLEQEDSSTNVSPTQSEVQKTCGNRKSLLLNKSRPNLSGQEASSTNASLIPSDVQKKCDMSSIKSAQKLKSKKRVFEDDISVEEQVVERQKQICQSLEDMKFLMEKSVRSYEHQLNYQKLIANSIEKNNCLLETVVTKIDKLITVLVGKENMKV